MCSSGVPLNCPVIVQLVPGIYSIVGKLCESGNDYIDLVIESGLLARLETAISTGNLDCQVFALEAIECISRGTQKHHDALLVIDIVETLITLLQSPTKYIRRVALCTLANLYKGQLTPECRMSIQQKVPQILINITNVSHKKYTSRAVNLKPAFIKCTLIFIFTARSS